MAINTSTDEGLNELLAEQHRIGACRAVLEMAVGAIDKLEAEAQNEH